MAFGTGVWIAPGTPASHLSAWFQVLIQLFANAHPERQMVTAEIHGSLPPSWEALSDLAFWLLPGPAWAVVSM